MSVLSLRRLSNTKSEKNISENTSVKGRLHQLFLIIPEDTSLLIYCTLSLVNISRSFIMLSYLSSNSSRRVALSHLKSKSSNLWVSDYIWSKSLKLPNFWISAPTRSWGEVPLVALRSSVSLGECHKPDHSSLLSHCAVSIIVKACLACSANFTEIKRGRFSLATCFSEILFRIRENVLGDFRNVKTSGGDVKKCNLLQSNDSSYSWRANIFYFYIYEW
jgi:hypothetical protein